jgi:hypothetical protein
MHSAKGSAMKRKIPYANHSPHGWWIASYLMRAAWNDEKKPKTRTRHLVWENTIILKAPDRERAYKKALTLASQACGPFDDLDRPGRRGRWVVEGLSSLLPIYEKLTDGAEISWTEYKNITTGRIHRIVRKKHQLESFDDTAAIGDTPG